MHSFEVKVDYLGTMEPTFLTKQLVNKKIFIPIHFYNIPESKLNLIKAVYLNIFLSQFIQTLVRNFQLKRQ